MSHYLTDKCIINSCSLKRWGPKIYCKKHLRRLTAIVPCDFDDCPNRGTVKYNVEDDDGDPLAYTLCRHHSKCLVADCTKRVETEHFLCKEHTTIDEPVYPVRHEILNVEDLLS
jgi:hypothetical protein